MSQTKLNYFFCFSYKKKEVFCTYIKMDWLGGSPKESDLTVESPKLHLSGI